MRTGRSRPLPRAKREASQLRASDEEGSFAVAGLGRRGKLRILVLGRRGPLSGVICAASSDACRFTASGAPNSPLHALGTKNYPPHLGAFATPGNLKFSPHLGAFARPAPRDPKLPPTAHGSFCTSCTLGPPNPAPPPHPPHMDAFARPVNPESLHRTWALLCAARLGNARLSPLETPDFPSRKPPNSPHT